MTQEDKDLLVRDLCARLAYNVIVHIHNIDVCDSDNYLYEDYLAKFRTNSIQIKPYLRPMSSMTEEEYKVYHELVGGMFGTGILINLPILEDFLNKNHFDYHGLIEKGLAIVAPEGMYNLKDK